MKEENVGLRCLLMSLLLSKYVLFQMCKLFIGVYRLSLPYFDMASCVKFIKLFLYYCYYRMVKMLTSTSTSQCQGNMNNAEACVNRFSIVPIQSFFVFFTLYHKILSCFSFYWGYLHQH